MGTIGRACVVPQNVNEARISYHLFRIRVDKELSDPAFLVATISRSGVFQQQFRKLARGAIMSGLNTKILREIRFLIPPKDRQATYIKQSEKV